LGGSLSSLRQGQGEAARATAASAGIIAWTSQAALPFAAGLVIVTHPIVMAIPHGSVSKKRISPPENAEIVCRRGLVARFNRKLLTCPKANGCRLRSASVRTIERRFIAVSG